MKRKTKLVLAITLTITALLLVVSFAYMSKSGQELIDELNKLMDNPPEDNYAALALFYALAIVASVGLVMKVMAFPMVVIAVNYAVFIPILLTTKSETKLLSSTKALLISSLIFTILSIIPLLFCWLVGLVWFTEMQNVALLILLTITDLCLIASLIVVITEHSKLKKYCRSLSN